jgi:maltose O-acetyltransferase
MLKKIYSALFHFAKQLPGSARQSLGSRIRISLLRRLAGGCGRDINVLGGAEIGAPHNLTIGDNSAIGLGCYLSCLDKVTIGDRVLMGPGVMIYTSNHVWNSEALTYFRQGETLATVTIKDDAWIGARSIILPGVVIGKGCTVAAGAVVTRSTADYSIVAGVPAVQIGTKPIGDQVAP